MDDAHLDALAARLQGVGGVVAVVLGGSRARGTHRPDSDYDIGLYYRGALDLAALGALAGDHGDGRPRAGAAGAGRGGLRAVAYPRRPSGAGVPVRVMTSWNSCCARARNAPALASR